MRNIEKTHQNLVDCGREIVQNAPQIFIDVDVEGDGPAGFGSLLSIGAIAPRGETFYAEIAPQTERFLRGPHEFCETHGLNRERLSREGLNIATAAINFANWTNNLAKSANKLPVFTAFNAGYDWAHVDLALALAGISRNPFGIAPFDIKSLAMCLGEKWDFAQTAKDKLPQILTPAREFTHNALDDARWQQEQHFALAGYMAKKNELVG